MFPISFFQKSSFNQEQVIIYIVILDVIVKYFPKSIISVNRILI